MLKETCPQSSSSYMGSNQESNSILSDCGFPLLLPRLSTTFELNSARSWSEVISVFAFCCAKAPPCAPHPIRLRVSGCYPSSLVNSVKWGRSLHTLGLEVQLNDDSAAFMALTAIRPWVQHSGLLDKSLSQGLLMACFLSFAGVFIEELLASSKM